MENSMDVVQYFSCAYSFFRTVQERNGEWRGFFSYLRRNLFTSAHFRTKLTLGLVFHKRPLADKTHLFLNCICSSSVISSSPLDDLFLTGGTVWIEWRRLGNILIDWLLIDWFTKFLYFCFVHQMMAFCNENMNIDQ